MTLIFTVLVLAAAIVWLARRPSGAGDDATDRDPDVLNEAEREVRDIDAMASPDDAADHLPDWGPGVPSQRKPPRG